MTNIELPVKPELPFQSAKLYWLNEHAIVLEIADDPSRQDHTLFCQQFIWQLADILNAYLTCNPATPSGVISAHALARVVDVVPGYQNLTVVFANNVIDEEPVLEFILQHWLQTINSSAATKLLAHDSECTEIAINYGGEYGPDLSVVAKHHNLTETDVIQLHSEALYTVLFMGFQPGFAYLHGLPDQLVTPRRSTPRLQISAGSVGIGGRQTGIYPKASPGGWQIIGRMADDGKTLFDIQHENPSLLKPAQKLRFVAA